MTLIIAADVQDHLILAGDHCAVMSRVSNSDLPDLVIDNYRKVYPWKYGAITASGDVALMILFCRLFAHHESSGCPIDLLQVAREVKQMRTRAGVPRHVSTGNIFFTLPGREGLSLYGLFVREDTVDYEIIEPISTRFSMREATPDPSSCNAFNRSLRPSFFFQSTDAFHGHHLDLLGAFYAGQSAVDGLVTSNFDVIMLEKRTGTGAFWLGRGGPKPLVTIDIGI